MRLRQTHPSGQDKFIAGQQRHSDKPKTELSTVRHKQRQRRDGNSQVSFDAEEPSGDGPGEMPIGQEMKQRCRNPDR
jgi:hypothetical protein